MSSSSSLLLIHSTILLFCSQVVFGIGINAQALFPPRGWNSYDSFSWIISEEEFLQNADIVSKQLLHHGYEYVVVDYLWYRRKVTGAYTNSLGFDVIDEWGRPIPDSDRWPSSKGGRGFKEVADLVHNMGLKFGIHVMRGISTQAVNNNTLILDPDKGSAYVESGKQWRAADIGVKERICPWMSQGFMSVDTNLGAGKAFLKSLYHQYAEWGVDFVKLDCVFGEDMDRSEVLVVSETLQELDRPIVLSLSPGVSVTTDMAVDIHKSVNMYRVTGDDWDSWKDVSSHFSISRDMAGSGLIGAEGLKGKSWPDLDMLPMGWLTDPGSNQGPHRKCNLTPDEQRTQMTLWSMFRSPIIFGGDLRQIDKFTLDLITNPTLLEINSFSSKNMEFSNISSSMRKSHGSNQNADNFTSETDEQYITRSQFGLTSCKESERNGFFHAARVGGMGSICWKRRVNRDRNSTICLEKRQPVLTWDEEVRFKNQYSGMFHLVPSGKEGLCLDASTGTKLSSGESKLTKFSPCEVNSDQLWTLSKNGTLRSSYSQLCMQRRKIEDDVNDGMARSWLATGENGKVYVSFFNLGDHRMSISTTIKDLANVLPQSYLKNGSCNVTEVWTSKNLGVITGTIVAEVAPHGCALFVLQCV